MQVRDAVPEDADRLADLARRGPVNATVAPRSLRDMIRDRTVLVAERSEEDGEATADDADTGEEDTGVEGDDASDEAVADDRPGDDERLVGYVSFDADEDAVVIHHLVADGEEALDPLLDRPLAFADDQGLPTVIGLAPEEPAVEPVEDRGFEVVERRRFGGDKVVRYERPVDGG